MNDSPYLTDAQIEAICEPLKQPAAQIKALRRMGLLVHRKPNGRPLVARAEFERVMVGGAAPAQNQPAPNGVNVVGLQQWARGRKGGPGGQKAQGR